MLEDRKMRGPGSSYNRKQEGYNLEVPEEDESGRKIQSNCS
jgi:hypothetical protein